METQRKELKTIANIFKPSIIRLNNFIGGFMSKIYKCKLMQVTEEQGYIQGSQTIEASLLFWRFLREVRSIDTILVKKTLNPFIFKEIMTGIEIPALRIKDEGEYKPYAQTRKVKTNSAFKTLHTFIEDNRRYSPIVGERNSLPEASVSDVNDYLSQDKIEFAKKLRNHFVKGEIKRNNKMLKESIEEDKIRKERGASRRLSKKYGSIGR